MTRPLGQLVGGQIGAPRPAPDAGPGTRAAPDLASYRAVAAELVAAVARTPDPATAGQLILSAVRTPELAAVLRLVADRAGVRSAVPVSLLDALPDGPAPGSRGARDAADARQLATLTRVHLLSQIDVLWWGSAAPYRSDAEVDCCADLVDLERLRRENRLAFRYRRLPGGTLTRGLRAIERRVLPGRTPHTAGLRFAQARPEVVTLLNQVAREFARQAPGAPPLWVTSLARSVEYQRHLRDLGYPAVLPSAHCVGYAVDVEIAWYRRFGVAAVLERVLLTRQETGQVNLVDEGQVWHVCVSPQATGELLGSYHQETRPCAE